jgi:hypothetical protein
MVCTICHASCGDFQPEHKMQSDTKPGISFSLVPKMLDPLTSLWAPRGFIVSFKLETDEELLLPKAKQALNKYRHHVSLFGAWFFESRVSTV